MVEVDNSKINVGNASKNNTKKLHTINNGWKNVGRHVSSVDTKHICDYNLSPKINTDNPGVYIIYKINDDNDKIAMYVGKSDKSVYDRITYHCSELQKVDNEELYRFIKHVNRVRYYYLKIEDEQIRSNYERSLYEIYGGKNELYNNRKPTGKIININPPFDIRIITKYS